MPDTELLPRPGSQTGVDSRLPVRPSPELPLLPALMPVVGFLVLLGLSVVLAAGHRHISADITLALLTAAVAGCTWFSRPAVALLLAGCAWLDYDGFVAGHDGSLTWHGRTDVVRIVVLASTTTITLLVRRVVARS